MMHKKIDAHTHTTLDSELLREEFDNISELEEHIQVTASSDMNLEGDFEDCCDLLLFMGYMWQFYAPIQGLTRLNQMLQMAAAAAERVFEILDAQPEVDDKKNAIDLPAIRGDITFEDVAFSYDGEKNALNGVSFHVKAGQMIGLSGPSGAGKTTLINLLGRFYDVTEGSITIDGYDIKDVKVRSLRDQIGIVLQDPFLFHGSIAENIAYSKPNASRAEVIAAAKAANAHGFIMNFPGSINPPSPTPALTIQ